jgi:hypothetical protein
LLVFDGLLLFLFTGNTYRTHNGELAMHMRKSLKALFLLLAAAVPLTAGCRGKPSDRSASSVPSAPLPIWEPDAKLLEELGPMTTVDDYQVRPPKGYSLNPPAPNTTGAIRAYYWTGTPREDKTAPYLLITLVSSPPGEAKERTLEKELNELLEGFHRRRSNWTQTSPERGQVNGMTFVRSYWSGIDPESQAKMHGFMYATRDGSTFIHLSSQDVEPHRAHTLKLAEAAVLTLKK